MRKSAIPLVAILALALVFSPVKGMGTVHVVPIAPPGCDTCSPTGGAKIILGSPGPQHVTLNFTINVVAHKDAYNIQALFVFNDTNPSTLSGAPTFTETGMGSPEAGTLGNPLNNSGLHFGFHWGIPSGGIFPTWYYNYTYVWAHLSGGTNGFNDWKAINLDFTVNNATTVTPAQFYIMAIGNAISPTDFKDIYKTPFSETTNIVVIPEFFLGTLAAIIMPLLALAGYMHFRRNGAAAPAVSLNT